jgi:hypothetical protein
MFFIVSSDKRGKGNRDLEVLLLMSRNPRKSSELYLIYLRLGRK